MSFQRWLLAQRKRDDPVGDLARDFEQDRKSGSPIPRRITPGSLMLHLIHRGACDEAVSAVGEAAREWRRTHKPELEEALKDLRFLLDERLYLTGGHPAAVALISDDKLIAIADAEEDSEPELLVLSTEKYLEVWRAARAALAKDEDGNIADLLHDAGYPMKCVEPEVDSVPFDGERHAENRDRFLPSPLGGK